MAEKPGDVMDIDEVSAYLKLPKQTVYRLAQGGKIPGRKAGRQWRFHKPAIDEWLAARPETNGSKSESK